MFSLDGGNSGVSGAGRTGLQSTSGGGGQYKSVLDSLPDLWEQADYDEEYDLSNFLHNLKN